jgi:hypothetical protein
MLIIPALGRLRQEDWEFKASPELHSKTLSQKKKRKRKDHSIVWKEKVMHTYRLLIGKR